MPKILKIFNIPSLPAAATNNKRCLHIRLYQEIYYNLRGLLFRNDLKLQELFQEFIFLCLSEDPRALSIIEELKEKKEEKRIAKFTYKRVPDIEDYKKDIHSKENIYDLIEREKDV